MDLRDLRIGDFWVPNEDYQVLGDRPHPNDTLSQTIIDIRDDCYIHLSGEDVYYDYNVHTNHGTFELNPARDTKVGGLLWS